MQDFELIVKPKFSYAIKTMGCKANIYDSLVLENELSQLGGTRNDQNPDLFILNSCTVTVQADKQAHREVNLVKKKNPTALTMVTGCYAEVNAPAIALNPNVDSVMSNQKKNEIAQWVKQKLQINSDSDLSLNTENEVYWGQLPTDVGKTRGFLKIQEGCNDFCTYCIIPYARGKSRSVSAAKIITEINRLIEFGVKEIVITGTNIADWGQEFELTLEDLLESILKATPIQRIRLTSLDPSEISDRLLNLMKTPDSRIMPHLHVSLQSPVSRVLRAMKRNYRTEEVIECLNKIYLANANIFVGMDIIAGFPSETEAEHQEALAILKNLPWTRLHVFPYSERPGTPALKIKPAVEKIERKKRAQELISLSQDRYYLFAKKQLGQTLPGVLLESPHQIAHETFLSGHSRNYFKVIVKSPNPSQFNSIQSLLVTNIAENQANQEFVLEGTIV